MRIIRANISYVVPLRPEWEEILDEMGVDSDDPEEMFDALDMHLQEFQTDAHWALHEE